MARKRVGVGPGHHSILLDAPGIEVHPPRTVLCTACGEWKDVKVTLPLFSRENPAEFQRQVDEFIAAHAACFKEGK